QLGFLWGGLTMGMLLSLPLIVAGLAFVWNALHPPMLLGRGTQKRELSEISTTPAPPWVTFSRHHRATACYPGVINFPALWAQSLSGATGARQHRRPARTADAALGPRSSANAGRRGLVCDGAWPTGRALDPSLAAAPARPADRRPARPPS